MRRPQKILVPNGIVEIENDRQAFERVEDELGVRRPYQRSLTLNEYRVDTGSRNR